MLVAICSCRSPKAASDLTCLRCSRLALKLGRGTDIYLLCRADRFATSRCHFLERSAAAFEYGLPCRAILPPQYDPVDIGRADLETVTNAVAALGGNWRRTGAQEGIVEDIALLGMVQHR